MTNKQQPAVIVKDLYKSFRLPIEQSGGLKQSLLNIFRRSSKRRRGYNTQRVLRGINFEIKKGEFFGIVGKNGSGKSTLLKLLAGVYTPDKGLVQVNGSLTPFIELGVGFNPELTGRENIYLNGALLGFSHKEIDTMYDDIVEFAELHEFMDQKLKNYSSGMQVRLAFSIAVRANSDILLFDEVLAVGDAAFQQKCYEKFADIKRQGTTIILVTHDMSAVQRFCDRAVLIDKGEIEIEGNPLDIADRYLEENYERAAQTKAKRKDQTRVNYEGYKIDTIKLKNNKRSINIGDPVGISFQTHTPGKTPYNVGIQVFRQDGVYVYGTNSLNAKKGPFVGGVKIEVSFPQHLAPGSYNITLALMDDKAESVIKYLPKVERFTVKQQTLRQGLVLLDESWELK